MNPLTLDLDDIQGDILIGLQKGAENFIFCRLPDVVSFKKCLRHYVIPRIISAERANQREQVIERRRKIARPVHVSYHGINLGFTRDGMTCLLGGGRPKLDPSFEKGADHPDVTANLRDPQRSLWLSEFIADRIDAVFLVAGPDTRSVTSYSNTLLGLLGTSVKVVYSEVGRTRPGSERKREHFGFVDGISQPGIRGLTPVRDPRRRPDEGLPGQGLVWPGEFVFGYPGQHPDHPTKEGPPPEMAAPWMRNGSYMVFRRLEQRVPEFRRFIREQAARLGMDPELLVARMVGRWKDGAPLELAPQRDDLALARDEKRNNDFGYGNDLLQKRCPYAAHIRKVYPRDDTGNAAEVQRHRIFRSGIPFGPEVEAGETITRHQRGLMFVCYQTSIERQFEYLQRHANDPEFVDGKFRPGSGAPVTPGYDPIIGQAAGGGARAMDEPYPNYPSGNRRTTLGIPHPFVALTGAGYFFMPSISALRTVLT